MYVWGYNTILVSYDAGVSWASVTPPQLGNTAITHAVIGVVSVPSSD